MFDLPFPDIPLEYSHELTSEEIFIAILAKIQQKFPLEELKKDPPSHMGCYRFFSHYFANEDMLYDIPFITRMFLQHEFNNLSLSDNEELPLMHNTLDTTPSLMNSRLIISVIVNCANKGNEYAKQFLLKLYKTYYKKEYNAFKRFRSLTTEDVLSLIHTQDKMEEENLTVNLARILYIAELSDIQLDAQCEVFYILLNDVSEPDAIEAAMVEDEDEDYNRPLFEIREELECIYGIDELEAIYESIYIFLEKACVRHGLNPDYMELNLGYDDLLDRLALTRRLLMQSRHMPEIDEEELVLYSMILLCVIAASNNAAANRIIMNTTLFGKEGSLAYKDYEPKFRAKDIAVPAKKPLPQPTPENPNKKTMDPQIKSAEIEELKRSLRLMESENNALRLELSEKKAAEKDHLSTKEQLEIANRELAALRTHVYNMTQQDTVKDIPLEAMKEEISKLRILIIGGHPNWIAKLKNEFPNWTFITPEASGTTDTSIINKADYIYFFTETISHTRYFQFKNIICERKARFGYLHGVNIDSNIRDIYKDTACIR